jgi:hypothetical protein
MMIVDTWKSRLLAGNGSPLQSGAPGAELANEHWHSYFKAVAQARPGTLVSVEVARGSEARGRTREPRLLRAIGYRRSEDVVHVDAGGEARDGGVVRFFIPAPRNIRIADGGQGHEILVRDAAGTLTLIRLFHRGLA